MTSDQAMPTCFIAMPITVHEDEAKRYGDEQHWAHVMDHLFVPAIRKAGYEPILPSASGTSMIHGRIVKHLSEADLVLCDLSAHNPNVMFELGVRTSLDKPVALVKDENLKLPFDIQGLNTHAYASNLNAWTLDEQIDALSRHITASVAESHGANPLWQHFGVAISAAQPPTSTDPADAKVQVILERMERMEHYVRALRTGGGAGEVIDGQAEEVGSMLLRQDGAESVSFMGREVTVRTNTASLDRQGDRARLYVGAVGALGYPAVVQGFDSTSIDLVVAWDARASFSDTKRPSIGI